MRRYADEIEVRVGVIDGVEAPAQLIWRGRLWQVHALVGHWVETAPWWQQPAVQGLLGVEDGASTVASVAALVAERECWRVEAGRGRLGPRGVFELVCDGATGRWRLTGCED